MEPLQRKWVAHNSGTLYGSDRGTCDYLSMTLVRNVNDKKSAKLN